MLATLIACNEPIESSSEQANFSVRIQGWGEVSEVHGTRNLGETLIIEATPRNGWNFDGWRGDVTSDEATLSLVMEGDLALVATFSEEVSDQGWGETAVRKVLQTFAWGGFPTDAQIEVWASMPPEDAIEEMLTFEPTNDKLSPPILTTSANASLSTSLKAGARLRGSLGTSQTIRTPFDDPMRPASFHPLSPLSPTYAWLMAIRARAEHLLPPRGLLGDQHHMVASQLKGVGSHTGIRHYDNIMGRLQAGATYEAVLAQSSLNAAIAFQYGHNYNRWQDETFKGNEDFAREFHQLFFGILGDATLLGGAEGEAYHLITSEPRSRTPRRRSPVLTHTTTPYRRVAQTLRSTSRVSWSCTTPRTGNPRNDHQRSQR